MQAFIDYHNAQKHYEIMKPHQPSDFCSGTAIIILGFHKKFSVHVRLPYLVVMTLALIAQMIFLNQIPLVQ